jgi:N-acetylglutamate synthase-like GNAT family acetyltransferase
MKIILNGHEYTFLIGYQKDDNYRAAFNELAVKTFNLSFAPWYQSGYWKEKYIPYTLFDGEKAVANSSINIMDFNAFGEKKRYIQIGTVMTDVEYRNQGLNKFLLEKILEDWKEKCHFIYLFANSTVLNFYPKFGFVRAKEYEYSKRIDSQIIKTDLEQLDMDAQINRDKLYDYAKNAVACSALSMNENADLVLFYCITVMKDCVFYIKSLDIIAVAKFGEHQLKLLDVFSKNEVNLDEVIQAFFHYQIDKVILGFTPKDASIYESEEIYNDDVLFIQEGKTQLFDENKVMFPLLSHA